MGPTYKKHHNNLSLSDPVDIRINHTNTMSQAYPHESSVSTRLPETITAVQTQVLHGNSAFNGVRRV